MSAFASEARSGTSIPEGNPASAHQTAGAIPVEGLAAEAPGIADHRRRHHLIHRSSTTLEGVPHEGLAVDGEGHCPTEPRVRKHHALAKREAQHGLGQAAARDQPHRGRSAAVSPGPAGVLGHDVGPSRGHRLGPLLRIGQRQDRDPLEGGRNPPVALETLADDDPARLAVHEAVGSRSDGSGDLLGSRATGHDRHEDEVVQEHRRRPLGHDLDGRVVHDPNVGDGVDVVPQLGRRPRGPLQARGDVLTSERPAVVEHHPAPQVKSPEGLRRVLPTLREGGLQLHLGAEGDEGLVEVAEGDRRLGEVADVGIERRGRGRLSQGDLAGSAGDTRTPAGRNSCRDEDDRNESGDRSHENSGPRL